MNVHVGIIGFGTVGTGTVKILLENAPLIRERTGIGLNIKKVADLDIERDRGVCLPREALTTRAEEVINDPEIEIVVELIGGVHPAKEFILEAIERGKHVVTANKALLATEGREIFEAAEKKGVLLGFEASVAGGIPIIKTLREALVANRFLSIYGIINGTSNYILTKMSQEGREFQDALREAQAKGYAEADPTFDIEGIDAAHKLTILASLAFGLPLSYDKLYREGISKVTALDIRFAEELGYRVKLLAIAKAADTEVEMRVHPTMVPEEYLISKVEGVLNAVYVVGDAVGETMFYGRGAGDMPTGSAVVADIVDIARKAKQGCSPSETLYIGKRPDLRVRPIEEIESLYYFRFSAIDRPGVLSKISGIFGQNRISIASVIQKGRRVGEAVPLVILTHRAREADVQKALTEIRQLDVVKDEPMMIRVEGPEPS